MTYRSVACHKLVIVDEVKSEPDINIGDDIEDITCPRVDMNFIFEWSTRYLTSECTARTSEISS